MLRTVPSMHLQYSLRWRIVDRRSSVDVTEAEAQLRYPSRLWIGPASPQKWAQLFFFLCALTPASPESLRYHPHAHAATHVLTKTNAQAVVHLDREETCYCIYVFGLRTVVELFERRKYIDVVSEVGFPSLREDGGREAPDLTQEKSS